MYKYILLALSLFSMVTADLNACKLLMLVSKNNQPLNPGIVNLYLGRLQEQGNDNEENNNPHGWGIVAFDKTGQPIPGYTYYQNGNIEETPRFASYHKAYDDPNFDNAQNTVSTSRPYIVIAHVRYASSGPQNIPDPHPFLFQRDHRWFTFAHNGALGTSVQNLMFDYVANIDTTIYDQINTQVDSGVYFGFLVANWYNNSLNNLPAVTDVMKWLDISTGWNKNFIFSNGTEGFAYKNSLTGSHDLKYYNQGTYDLVMSVMDEGTGYEDGELSYNPTASRNVRLFLEDSRLKFTRSSIYYSNLKNQWAWESIPIIDSTDNVQAIANNFPGNPTAFLASTGDSLYLEDLAWESTTHFGFNPVAGVKVRITDFSEGSNYGYPIPGNSQIQLKRDEENWVGYWLMNNQTLREALGSVFYQVKRVYAQDWVYNSSDLACSCIENFDTHSEYNKMEFGKMYIIELKEDADSLINFSWNVGLYSSDFINNTNFYGSEFVQADSQYEALNISFIEGNNEINEISAWVENTCIGSVQVNEFPVQMKLFTRLHDNKEIMFHFKQNGHNLHNSDYQVLEYNPNSSQYSPVNLQCNYITVKYVKFKIFSTPDTVDVPDTTNLVLRVYPNPFSRIVYFDLTNADSQISSIDIYNIKGQKIKTCLNPNQSPVMAWFGDDAQGHTVKEGIYLCRIKYLDKTVFRKITFLK